MQMWRAFKYSRRMGAGGEERSFCGLELSAISQTILHSQPDSQGVRRERWLHVFTEGGKILELVLSSSLLEVRLYIVSECRQELVVLERVGLDGGWDFRTNTAKRVLRCRFGERRFQIVFFSEDDISAFENGLGDPSGPGASAVQAAESQEPGREPEAEGDSGDRRRVVEDFLSLLLGGRTSP